MTTDDSSVLVGGIVEQEETLSLARLSELCGAGHNQILELVEEGVLETTPSEEPLFTGTALRRARLAMRLQRDLGVNTAGVAVVIELLERIETLEQRFGH